MHTSCPISFIFRNILRKMVVSLYKETHKNIHCTVVWNKGKLQKIFTIRKESNCVHKMEYYLAMKMNTLTQPVPNKTSKENDVQSKLQKNIQYNILHEN